MTNRIFLKVCSCYPFFICRFFPSSHPVAGLRTGILEIDVGFSGRHWWPAQALHRNWPIRSTFLSWLRRGGKMDNLTKRNQPDRSKINMSEDFEVKHWLKALGVSRNELQRAVEKVGNSAAAVRKELGV